MQNKHDKSKIISKDELASGVKSLRVYAPLIAAKAKPGQFVIIRIDERGERIPVTIVDSDSEEGTLTLVVQEVGKTTKKLGRLREGEEIADLVGPLGNPSEIEKFGQVVVIGGGVGVAAAYEEAKALKKAENRVVSIIGARSKDLLFFEQEMRQVSDELYVTTDDGTRGRKGFVTDVLKDLIDQRRHIDLVFAVGPTIMMKIVSKITEPHGIRTIVSLNPIMLDGTGMCGACRVRIGGQTKFTCVDGPDFDGHLVDFDELMARQRMYLKEEKLALQMYENNVR